MTYVVGLTGGIGSGKTAVAEAFAALGVEVADADAAAHAVTARDAPGYAAVLATFGEDDVYDQNDSAGFISLYGLPIKVRAKMAEKKTAEKKKK